MYTGITQGLFPVVAVQSKPNLIHYTVKLPEELLVNLTIGASVNIDGVCQTVVSIDKEQVSFDAGAESLRLTTLASLEEGRMVSVERSHIPGQENGGHNIAGHIIGTATVAAVQAQGDSRQLTIQCNPEWIQYIFEKGFIALDGCSLTVGQVDEAAATFTINLIPETLRLTNFDSKVSGDLLNLELDHQTRVMVDTLNRVVKRTLKSQLSSPKSDLWLQCPW